MKNKFILFLSIILLANLSYSQEKNNWKTINKGSYKIEYPPEWQLDTTGRMNTQFIVLSKRGKEDTFRENVNLIIQDLSNRILNLESYTALSLRQIKGMKNAKIIENKRTTYKNKKAQQIIWRGFVSGKDLKFKQIYFIENNKAYVLTLTCQEKAYEDYEMIGTKILNSFTLK